jgi:hypothetical protein
VSTPAHRYRGGSRGSAVRAAVRGEDQNLGLYEDCNHDCDDGNRKPLGRDTFAEHLAEVYPEREIAQGGEGLRDLVRDQAGGGAVSWMRLRPRWLGLAEPAIRAGPS